MTPERVVSRTRAQVRACLLALAVPAATLLGAGVGVLTVGMPQSQGATAALLALSTGAGLLVVAADTAADVVAARLVERRLRALRVRQELSWARQVAADARDEDQRRLDARLPVVNPLDRFFEGTA